MQQCCKDESRPPKAGSFQDSTQGAIRKDKVETMQREVYTTLNFAGILSLLAIGLHDGSMKWACELWNVTFGKGWS